MNSTLAKILKGARGPQLRKAWDEYGHMITLEQIVMVKGSSTFLALAWEDGDGMVNYATLAWDGDTWQWQDDGHDPIPLSTFKLGRVPSDCDWINFPGDSGYATGNFSV